tara:strand:- start:294 stop:536 length:243 start_codon:yes stop_codon:yes gene_type:complete
LEVDRKASTKKWLLETVLAMWVSVEGILNGNCISIIVNMNSNANHMQRNAVIVYFSCSGGAHHDGQKDWPFVLLGGMDKS